MANVAVDPGGVRPIGLHRDRPEAPVSDELARDAGPHPVELRGAMGGFPEQDHAGVPDPIEQRAELDGLDVFQRFHGLPKEGCDRHFAAPRADDSRCGSPILPPLRANERDELHGAQFFLPVFVLTDSRHSNEFLRPWRCSHRDHQPPADGKLRPERVRNRRPARGDEDRVVGGMLGPSERAVAMADVNVVEAQVLHSPARQLGQRGVPLDGVNLRGDAGEDGGGIAGAGADLEDAVTRGQLERGGHEGHDIGLGDRLPLFDGKRRVLVGEFGRRSRDKHLPRNLKHGIEHRPVNDPAGCDLLLDHSGALIGECLHGVPPPIGARALPVRLLEPAPTLRAFKGLGSSILCLGQRDRPHDRVAVGALDLPEVGSWWCLNAHGFLCLLVTASDRG